MICPKKEPLIRRGSFVQPEFAFPDDERMVAVFLPFLYSIQRSLAGISQNASAFRFLDHFWLKLGIGPFFRKVFRYDNLFDFTVQFFLKTPDICSAANKRFVRS